MFGVAGRDGNDQENRRVFLADVDGLALHFLRQLRRRSEAQSVLECVARAYGCSKQALSKQGTRGNEARAVAMVLVWDCCGVSLREIGELFGGAGYTAVAQMIGRTREKDRQGALKFKLAELLDKYAKTPGKSPYLSE